MGTLNAIYIRADDAKESRVRSAYPEAFTETGSEFFAVELSRDDFECPSNDLVALSRDLDTDVLWIAFQSVVDAFVYHHWRSGVLQRSLIYGAIKGGTWDQVEGTPEVWEADVFFAQSDLKGMLEDMEDADERRNTQQIFEERILKVGNWLPMVDARESARAIANHFGLPGWK